MGVKIFYEHPFYLPMWLISGLFPSSVTMQTRHDQAVPKTIATSQRNKLPLYQTQNGGPN